MIYCNKCNCNNCNCRNRVSQSTVINSDQAGRDGLSAYDSAIRTGKIPSNWTEAQFVEWNKGEKGDPGTNEIASTTVKGIVNQATVSVDTATAPSATYTQAEVQAILTELRDLKTKLRTAGILAT